MRNKKCKNQGGKVGGCTTMNEGTGKKYRHCDPKTCIKFVSVWVI